MRDILGAFALSVLLCACRSESNTGTEAPTSISIAPPVVATTVTGVVAFTATGDSRAKPAVAWSVNGIRGGSTALGTVTDAGVYTAPTVIPDGDSVVISAELVADASVRATSTVLFLPDRTSRDYYILIPRVVDAAQATPTRLIVVPPPSVTAVTFVPLSGTPSALTPIGANVPALMLPIDAATATRGYVTGTLHNIIGRLDYRTSAGDQAKLAGLSVNIRDAAMADVAITPLDAAAQRSNYVLNLRADTASIGPYPDVVGRTVDRLGNHFDFIDVVATVTSNHNRFYTTVRNEITGIGEAVLDAGAFWKATAAPRLRGVIAYPIDAFFDGAEDGFIHEIGHAWINYATVDPVLKPGAPHWPPSTMALGLMGFSIPPTGEGGQFRWKLTPLGDGTVRVSSASPTHAFSPLDLYLMGLMAASEVTPVQVLPPSTDVANLQDGQVLPATTYTIEDYVARMGPRVPSSVNAQRDFSTVCVVLSFGRLMTSSEMAFFDAACARAETRTPLTSSIGFARATAPGFYTATGGRGTLSSHLP